MPDPELQKFIVDQDISGIHERTNEQCRGLAVLVGNIVRETNMHGEKVHLVRGVIAFNRMVCWCLATSEREARSLFTRGSRRFNGQITRVQEFELDPAINVIYEFSPETAKKPQATALESSPSRRRR